jgi:hypothetical protein
MGDDHPHTLRATTYLADTKRALGDVVTAAELHRIALQGYRRVFGVDARETLEAESELAGDLTTLGDLSAAKELLAHAADGARRNLSHKDPSRVTIEKNHVIVTSLIRRISNRNPS